MYDCIENTSGINEYGEYYVTVTIHVPNIKDAQVYVKDIEKKPTGKECRTPTRYIHIMVLWDG